jgi:hypothetical protein
MRPVAGQGERGVALAVVVWFIAGMALLVAGIVSRATVDTRLAQAHLFRAQAEAAGDGAVRLFLGELLEGRFNRAAGGLRSSYRLGDHEVTVVAVPATALLDLASAPRGSLAALFQRYGELPRSEAEDLAGAVVEWRQRDRRGAGGGAGFNAVEDVLRVPGVTRSLLDSLRDLVTVAGGGVPNAAGLAWVAAQAPGRIAAGDAPPDAPGGRGALPALANSYRIDALVPVGERVWLRRRWMSLGGGSASGFPWSTQRVEAVRAVGVAP